MSAVKKNQAIVSNVSINANSSDQFQTVPLSAYLLYCISIYFILSKTGPTVNIVGENDVYFLLLQIPSPHCSQLFVFYMPWSYLPISIVLLG